MVIIYHVVTTRWVNIAISHFPPMLPQKTRNPSNSRCKNPTLTTTLCEKTSHSCTLRDVIEIWNDCPFPIPTIFPCLLSNVCGKSMSSGNLIPAWKLHRDLRVPSPCRLQFARNERRWCKTWLEVEISQKDQVNLAEFEDNMRAAR